MTQTDLQSELRLKKKLNIGGNMDNENLNELVARFYPPEQAAQVEKNIRKGDEIIASGCRFSADPAVIGDIKKAISARLTTNRRRRMNTTSLRTAVAAMIAIVAFVGIRDIVHQGGSLTTSGFAVASFWGKDATASMIADELDDIEYTIVSVNLDELETESDITIDSLELEIIKADNAFWRP